LTFNGGLVNYNDYAVSPDGEMVLPFSELFFVTERHNNSGITMVYVRRGV